MQGALADNMNGCPDGQAIQAADPSGKKIRCIAVPPPVDVSGLQAQIDNANAALLGAIAEEKNARIAADEALRESSGTEGGVAGTYAVTGTQVCTVGSRGFNSNLQPFIAPQPPPPVPNDPNPPPPAVITTVSISNATISGIQTFHEDGTGTLEVTFHVVGHPTALFGAPGPGGPGGGSVSTASGSFEWSVAGDRIFIGSGNLPGVVVQGGSAGATINVTGSPRFVGHLGKDKRLITVHQEGMAVEQQVLTLTNGQVLNQSRICIRERTLRKL